MSPARNVIALLLGLALSGCATVRCPAEGGRPWTEVTTRHLVLQTDLEEAEALRTAVAFERAREVVTRVAGLEEALPGRVTVVTFAKGMPLPLLLGSAGGFFSLEPGGARIVVANNPGRWAGFYRTQTFAHEYGHYLIRSVHGAWPRWLNEGLAEYLGQVSLDSEGEYGVVGRASPVLELLKAERSLYSLSDLWAWKYERNAAGLRTTRAYGSSWFWVSHLLREQGPRMQAFLKRTADGEGAREVFDSLFPGPEAERLEDAVTREYKQWSIDWAETKVAIREDPGPLEVRSLPPAEFHALMDRLPADVSKPEAWHEAHRREVLVHEPAALGPGLERVWLLPPQEQLREARALAAGHPRSGMARLAVARALLAAGVGRAEAERETQEAARLLHQDSSFQSLATLPVFQRVWTGPVVEEARQGIASPKLLGVLDNVALIPMLHAEVERAGACIPGEKVMVRVDAGGGMTAPSIDSDCLGRELSSRPWRIAAPLTGPFEIKVLLRAPERR